MSITTYDPFSPGCPSAEECILQEEVTLLKAPGPSLSIINDFGEGVNLFKCGYCLDTGQMRIDVLQDINSNVRMFYYALLCTCFPVDSQSS